VSLMRVHHRPVSILTRRTTLLFITSQLHDHVISIKHGSRSTVVSVGSNGRSVVSIISLLNCCSTANLILVGLGGLYSHDHTCVGTRTRVCGCMRARVRVHGCITDSPKTGGCAGRAPPVSGRETA